MRNGLIFLKGIVVVTLLLAFGFYIDDCFDCASAEGWRLVTCVIAAGFVIAAAANQLFGRVLPRIQQGREKLTEPLMGDGAKKWPKIATTRVLAFVGLLLVWLILLSTSGEAQLPRNFCFAVVSVFGISEIFPRTFSRLRMKLSSWAWLMVTCLVAVGASAAATFTSITAFIKNPLLGFLCVCLALTSIVCRLYVAGYTSATDSVRMS